MGCGYIKIKIKKNRTVTIRIHLKRLDVKLKQFTQTNYTISNCILVKSMAKTTYTRTKTDLGLWWPYTDQGKTP